MGQEILYCKDCQTRLRSSDFDRREAFRWIGEPYCARCAPAEAKVKSPTSDTPRRGSRTSRIMTMPGAGTTRRTVRKSGSPALPVAVAAGIGVVVLLLALAAGTGGGPPPAPEPPRERAAAPPPPPPPPPSAPSTGDRREETAVAAVRQAYEFARVNPKDFAGQIGRFQKAIDLARETAAWEAAQRGMEEARKREREAVEAEFAPTEAEVVKACDKKDFDIALKLLEQARGRRSDPAWLQRIDQRIAEVRPKANAAAAAARKPPEPPPPPKPAAKPAAPAGLVGHWKLDGGSGTQAADSSGRAHPGTLQKGAAWASAPYAGVRLDGKGAHVFLGTDLPQTRNLSGWTAAAWIRPERLPEGKDIASILAFAMYKGGALTRDSRLVLEFSSDGKLRVGARTTDSGELQVASSAAGVIEAGKWLHVAGAADLPANTIALYVNGQKIVTYKTKFKSEATPDTPSACATIGGGDDGQTQFFCGWIADVRLYSGSLPASEIAALAAVAPGPAELDVREGLALWLKSDAGLILEDDRVARWVDASPKGRNASQTASDRRPVLVERGEGGRPAVRFDGMDDLLTFSAPLEGREGRTTACVVAKKGGGSSVVVTVRDAVFVDGAPADGKGGGVCDESSVGRGPKGAFFAGDLAELLVFTRTLSEAERRSVERYLRRRFSP